MTKGECIAYAIEKEVSRNDLTEWLEWWEIKIEDFQAFMTAGVAGVDKGADNELNSYNLRGFGR